MKKEKNYVTATELRADIYNILTNIDEEGHPVTVHHKGRIFVIRTGGKKENQF